MWFQRPINQELRGLSVADLDSDGAAEIIIPSDVHYICAYQPDGTPVAANSIYGDKAWGRVGMWESLDTELRGWGLCGASGLREERYRTNFAGGAASIADMNGDGTLEVAVTGNTYDCGDQSSRYTGLYLFRVDRSRFKDEAGGIDWETVPVDTGSPLSEDYNEIENCHPNPVPADLDGMEKKRFFLPPMMAGSMRSGLIKSSTAAGRFR